MITLIKKDWFNVFLHSPERTACVFVGHDVVAIFKHVPSEDLKVSAGPLDVQTHGICPNIIFS